MNTYHLLLITPSQDKRFELIAHDYYISNGVFNFIESDNNVIAVYPVNCLAIESIDKHEDFN